MISYPIKKDQFSRVLFRAYSSKEERKELWSASITIGKLQDNSSIQQSAPTSIEEAELLCEKYNEPLLDNKSMMGLHTKSEDAMNIHRGMVDNLVYLIKHRCNVENVSYLTPLLMVLVRELERIDLVFFLTLEILEVPSKYLQPTNESRFVVHSTFRKLLEEYMPQTYVSLSSLGALDDRYLNMMFQYFFFELVTQRQALRLVGLYLFEGVKALYRYGLALIKGYKALIKGASYETANEFWTSVKADAVNVSNSEREDTLQRVLNLPESLPAIDQFLLHSNSKNKSFVEEDLIHIYAYESDNKSVFAFGSRAMPITDVRITQLHAEAQKSMPINSNSPTKKAIAEQVIERRSSNMLSIKSSNLQNRPNQSRLTMPSTKSPSRPP